MHRLAGLAVFAIVLLACLGLAEVGSRLLLRRPGFQEWPPGHVPGLRIPHETRGFANAPNFSGRRIAPDYNHAIVTNSLGMRDDHVDAHSSERRILAVGDSFTEGMGVEQSQTWTERLERRLGNVRVLNAGITAYSAAQMRVTAAELIPVVRPSLLIAGIHPHGCTRLIDPYVLLGGDTVRQSSVPRLRPATNGYRYSAFDRPWLMRVDLWITERSWFLGYVMHQTQQLRDRLAGRPTRPEDLLRTTHAPIVLEPLLAEIHRLHDVARRTGIPLVILLVNAQQRDGTFPEVDVDFNARIRAHTSGREIQVVDPLPALHRAAQSRPVLRFPSDAHWTPMAHGTAAAEVALALRQ